MAVASFVGHYGRWGYPQTDTTGAPDQAYGAATSGDGGLLLDVPEYTAGDTLIAVIITKDHPTNTPSPPAGWTERGTAATGSYSSGYPYSVQTFTRVADDEPSHYRWDSTGSGTDNTICSGIIVNLGPVDPTLVCRVENKTLVNGSAVFNGASLTMTTDETSLIVGITESDRTFSVLPTGYTTIMNNQGLYAGYKAYPGGGATGTLTLTAATASNGHTIHISIPAARTRPGGVTQGTDFHALPSADKSAAISLDGGNLNGRNVVNAANRNHVALLSSGRMLMAVQGYGYTAGVLYSDDGGETWFSTTNAIKAGASTDDQFTIATDEFDYIYLFIGHNSGGGTLYACTLGTDLSLTVLDSVTIPYSGYRLNSSMFTVDNPTAAGDVTQVVWTGRNTTLHYLLQVKFTRSTETFGSVEGVTTVTVPNDNTSYAHMFLISEASDYHIAKTPSSPVAVGFWRTALGTITPYKMTWDAVNHRFSYASSATVTITDTSSLASVLYEPTLDKIYVAEFNTSYEMQLWSSPYDTISWTSEGTVTWPTTGGSQPSYFAHLTTRGDGTIHVYHVEANSLASSDLHYATFDGASFSAVTNLRDNDLKSGSWIYTSSFSVWNAAVSAAGIFWGDVTNFDDFDLQGWVISGPAGSGAFVGWGIPMGIA